MRACQDWLQEHNVFVRMYKTSLESLHAGTRSEETLSELLPYADSADVRTHENKLLSRELGPTNAALVTMDLSAYKMPYHKLAAQFEVKVAVEVIVSVITGNSSCISPHNAMSYLPFTV
jgi:hypothetical protein